MNFILLWQLWAVVQSNFSGNVLIYTGHSKHSRISAQLKSTIIMQTCMGGWTALRNSIFRVYIFE